MRISGILLVIFLLPALLWSDEIPWQNYGSTHFIIYYKNAKDSSVSRIADKAEDYYETITDDLGFRRDNFWVRINRAKIYLYDDAQSYHEQTKQPEWSGGAAIPNEKLIYSYDGADSFFNTVLPHEMAHIIFREAAGFNNYAIPSWLDEGAACFQEKIRRSGADAVVKQARRRGSFIKLEDLGKLNPLSMQDIQLVELFYAESLSVVNFLVEKYGKDNFSDFCRDLNKFNNLDKAIQHAYDFNDLRELSDAWGRYLK